MISQYQRELAEASYSSQISGAGLTGWFSFQAASTSNKKHQHLSPSYFLRGMDVLLHVCLGPIPKRNYKKTSLQPNKCSSERLYPKSRASIHPHHHTGPSAGYKRAMDEMPWLHCQGREMSNLFFLPCLLTSFCSC